MEQLNLWQGCRIGITGANGSLGRALTQKLRSKGAFVIGFTHGPINNKTITPNSPQDWIRWKCGEENSLTTVLSSLDILVLNHGINPKGLQSPEALKEALEVNALSVLRLIEQFEISIQKNNNQSHRREVWVNTSEAEIQPALSPGYELSKRLIGQLVSLRWANLDKEQRKYLKIRKLILGPFRSELNPIGLMNPDFVAGQIIAQANLGLHLIIVTPNPLTYLIMPLTEVLRYIYYLTTKKLL